MSGPVILRSRAEIEAEECRTSFDARMRAEQRRFNVMVTCAILIGALFGGAATYFLGG